MWLFILTEAALFVLLFFSYFYLAQGGWRWPGEMPPKLRLVIPMLLILWISSGVLHWGERQVRAQRYSRGRAALALTILLGIVFLVMQVLEYMDHLKTLTPQTNAYGSIFYTITTFHAAHLVLGLLMLGYVLILPRYEPVDRPPHRPYHNAALYWHFVDFIWVWIVIFLYIGPNIR
jgi:cytochrome c oxidase subunit 3